MSNRRPARPALPAELLTISVNWQFLFRTFFYISLKWTPDRIGSESTTSVISRATCSFCSAQTTPAHHRTVVHATSGVCVYAALRTPTRIWWPCVYVVQTKDNEPERFVSSFLYHLSAMPSTTDTVTKSTSATATTDVNRNSKQLKTTELHCVPFVRHRRHPLKASLDGGRWLNARTDWTRIWSSQLPLTTSHASISLGIPFINVNCITTWDCTGLTTRYKRWSERSCIKPDQRNGPDHGVVAWSRVPGSNRQGG